MEGSNITLLLNIALWCITLIVVYIRRREIDAACFLLSTFVVFSICSFLTYNFEYSAFYGKNITLFPLLYLYLMIMLTMSPIIRLNIKKIRNFPNPPYALLDTIAWIYILCMAIKLPSDIQHIQTGMIAIMMDMGGDLYREGMSESSAGGSYVITSLPSIYVNITSEVITLIAFYNLLKRRKKGLTITLFVSLGLTPLGSIANGQRGGAFDIIIIAIGTYFLFAPVLSDTIQKYVKRIGLLLLFILMVPIVFITQSRFGDRVGSAEQSIYSYLGQQNLNFDLYGFDNNGIRNGDRVFPLFKKILGFDKVPNDFWERRAKYPYLKINDEVFIGYIGDFLLDFGPVISTVIFVLFTYIFLKLSKAKKSTFHFYQFIVIQFVLTLGLQGGLKLYPFADRFALKIFVFGLLYLYLRLYQNLKYHNYYRNNLKFVQNGGLSSFYGNYTSKR